MYTNIYIYIYMPRHYHLLLAQQKALECLAARAVRLRPWLQPPSDKQDSFRTTKLNDPTTATGAMQTFEKVMQTAH